MLESEKNSASYYLQDEMGSPIRLYGEDRNLRDSYGYDEFGQDLYGNQGKAQPFGFTGYQSDEIDTAVKPQWINPITGELTGESVVDTVYAIKMPKGTKVYTGPVGPQGGAYCGGYDVMQSFIKEPWKLDYKVISSNPLN